MILHPPIPVGILHAADILLLLVVGASFEAMTRTLSHFAKRRSKGEIVLKSELRDLRSETAKKRRLGPSAFVETSKMERLVLAKEKDLGGMEADRKRLSEAMTRMNRNAAILLNLVVFGLYFGIPMLAIDGMRVPVPSGGDDSLIDGTTETERASGYMRGMLFPLSYVGVGIRVAGIGLEERVSSVGALVVLWASQAAVGKVADCVDALWMR